MKRVLFRVLLVLAALALSTGCSAEKPAGPEPLAEVLISQIDREQDDYLSAVDDKSIDELLTLDSIHFGSFTGNDASELLALFKVNGVPHAGGLDRTIAALCDAYTYERINQKSFVADDVSVRLLADADHRSHVLYIGSTTYQGYTAYSVELYEVEEGGWTSKAVSHETFGKDVAFAFADNDTLQVFELDYSEGMPGEMHAYRYKYALYWDAAEAIFKRELQ